MNRLRRQADLFEPMHLKSLELAQGRLSDPSLFLDLGCGDGANMHSLQFRKVIGIDRDPEALQQARERWPYEFLEMDIDDPWFCDKLRQHLPRSPVLARISLSLHNVEDPVRLLEELRETLPSGSVLLLLSPDQDMSCAYPSETFDALYNLWKSSEPNSDTEHGRKLGNQMRQAGLQNILAAPYIFTTSGVPDLHKRELLFYVFNEFRLGDCPEDKQEEMECLLRDLQMEFRQPEFFFMATMFIGIGQVP